MTQVPARAPRFVQAHLATPADLAEDRTALQAGLLRTPASVSPKYFYDRLGSRLFEAITELPEYYPTRTEAAIFAAHGAAMAQCAGSGATLVDLGAGNCAKAASLFPLLEPSRYVAVDISVDFMRDALRDVQREYPQIAMTGVGMDFTRSIELPAGLIDKRPLFFYPGSSIGNFTPADALAFLRRVRAQAGGGGLLIGVDLVKSRVLLERAYDDELGVTAAFNLNLLRHVNAQIGSDFHPADWRHVALFDEAASRIEMHLEARRDLTVRWPNGQRGFRAGERMHTENSYKYTPAGFAALLAEAGFAPGERWVDPNGWFAVFWAPAR
ncbi:MAG: L-histidine N(alpha)-methyltransferase [Proteobacteria bacterium]|nr:L-histidine N(alpha)-methyltransferase [Pseudomonadota bacterium]